MLEAVANACRVGGGAKWVVKDWCAAECWEWFVCIGVECGPGM